MSKEIEVSTVIQYVDETLFDREKLINYLNIHSIVGNEIFSYCDKHGGRENSVSYPRWLDDRYGYTPLPVENFIRRIPFYFYTNDYKSNRRIGDLGCLISGIIQENRKDEAKDEAALEALYQTLEYLFYEKRFSLDDIFCYTVEQKHQVSQTNVFFQWVHYIRLCDELNEPNYFPDCFIASYNDALEKKGLSPIIYEISYIRVNEIFWRSGTKIEFEGTFPCDRNGNPIMKWIGLRVKNAKSITCEQDKSSSRGRLFVEVAPGTTIHALNCYGSDDGEDCWYQLYAGPKTMEFDYEILKESRIRLKYTQKEVADAIGATVRTYQKWESGDTTPDGHYLLRLLNWLDIRDVQDVVRYTE